MVRRRRIPSYVYAFYPACQMVGCLTSWVPTTYLPTIYTAYIARVAVLHARAHVNEGIFREMLKDAVFIYFKFLRKPYDMV